MEQSPYWEVK